LQGCFQNPEPSLEALCQIEANALGGLINMQNYAELEAWLKMSGHEENEHAAAREHSVWLPCFVIFSGNLTASSISYI
jgi:hypothetical protein